MNDDGSTVEAGQAPVKAGQGKCEERALARGLVLLMGYLLPHPCIISHVEDAGILFTPEKIYRISLCTHLLIGIKL